MLNLENVFLQFDASGKYREAAPFGNGHINDTYLVSSIDNEGNNYKYILQRINHQIFKKPKEVMDNIVGVTSFLKKKVLERGGNTNREILTVIFTKDNKSLYIDNAGEYWRMYIYVLDSISFDMIENANEFYQSGLAFGNFQNQLADYPAHKLHETIEGFHDTKKRFETFKNAVEKNVKNRAENVKNEIDFVLKRESLANVLGNALKNNELPLRVTHNDTKLNNILFDKDTRKPICIIDLDTIMPGLALNDFGDSIRFGANTGAEDEVDLSKVGLSLELFEAYAKGFISGCNGKLTENEIKMLPIGAMVMTFECGMRFLTDYLEGDVYFKIARENHNLDRARCQFKLVEDMENKRAEMDKIIAKYC